MLLFVGLGNPGAKYKTSRHNAGFIWLDQFIYFLQQNKYYTVSEPPIYNEKSMYCLREIRTIVEAGGEKKALLLKPLTYMNLSGFAVREVVNKYKIQEQNIFVAHDDLDIPLGQFKITKGKFPKTHNGIKSIHQQLGKANFWYIRLGIDNRNQIEQYKFIPPADFVLLPLTADELQLLRQAITKSIEQLWQVVQDQL